MASQVGPRVAELLTGRGGGSGPIFQGKAGSLDRRREAAAAYRNELDDRNLTFRAVPGGFEDAETGSIWRLDGLADSGPLAGRRLEPIRDAYVSFWFAWAAFHPETVVWDGPGG